MGCLPKCDELAAWHAGSISTYPSLGAPPRFLSRNLKDALNVSHSELASYGNPMAAYGKQILCRREDQVYLGHNRTIRKGNSFSQEGSAKPRAEGPCGFDVSQRDTSAGVPRIAGLPKRREHTSLSGGPVVVFTRSTARYNFR